MPISECSSTSGVSAQVLGEGISFFEEDEYESQEIATVTTYRPQIIPVTSLSKSTLGGCWMESSSDSNSDDSPYYVHESSNFLASPFEGTKLQQALEEEPVPPPPAPPAALPSIGTAKHFSGNCSPCHFWFRGDCSNGSNCNYCHVAHEGQKAKWRFTPSKRARAIIRERTDRLTPPSSTDGASAMAACPPAPGLTLPASVAPVQQTGARRYSNEWKDHSMQKTSSNSFEKQQQQALPLPAMRSCQPYSPSFMPFGPAPGLSLAPISA
mmetsp:Transcript_52019/g.113184  ORF Transcript_52019/g.113184 Transcript_52019/m.113184 type:complete len:268 (+) Transcript_52019:180-983(+)|eukprot:CAMPEP_0206543722 /NCGR_PEP_ID=MMETSP0325_2-20121206/11061_1 /ASSEMBLY_ACC=CAM_ASM_000347 /TAXON_ID=2866 /ORGANISM="Crypthecodinium cohnii, Strain Seligo" /LENGTH=267 /DNA_ID=CAMNT_0054042273 /DNA_START=57 /DNA_END=860 /DNA_ORIENTATION=+